MDAHTNPWLVFVLGCVGALAEEIIRLYALRNKPPKWFSSSWYLVVTGLYACLGGVVAILLPAVTPWAAFYAGVTLPTLIGTIAHRRKRDTLWANERSRDVVHAIEQEKSDVIRASTPEVPSMFRRLLSLIRDHADGL